MLPRLRPTYSNVTATPALAVALGTGTSYAVERLAANSVGAPHIKANAVQPSEIRAGAVKSPEIAAGAVRSGHLAAGSVRSGHLAAGNVTSDHVADGTVRFVDLAPGAAPSVLHAHVKWDGSRLNGKEVEPQDVVHTGTGTYTVNFNRSLDFCGVAATPAGDQTDLMATVNDAIVTVAVEHPTFPDTPVDGGFRLLVVC